jgi:hypothetical protein
MQIFLGEIDADIDVLELNLQADDGSNQFLRLVNTRNHIPNPTIVRYIDDLNITLHKCKDLMIAGYESTQIRRTASAQLFRLLVDNHIFSPNLLAELRQIGTSTDMFLNKASGGRLMFNMFHGSFIPIHEDHLHLLFPGRTDEGTKNVRDLIMNGNATFSDGEVYLPYDTFNDVYLKTEGTTCGLDSDHGIIRFYRYVRRVTYEFVQTSPEETNKPGGAR